MYTVFLAGKLPNIMSYTVHYMTLAKPIVVCLIRRKILIHARKRGQFCMRKGVYETVTRTCVGLASTLYIRCVYGVFGREMTKYTVIYGAYIRFWPTLCISQVHFTYHTSLGSPFWPLHYIGMEARVVGERQGQDAQSNYFMTGPYGCAFCRAQEQDPP